MKILPHQRSKAEECFAILREKGYVYLAGKPRSGKSLTALVVCELSSVFKLVAIICPKGAKGYPPKFRPDGIPVINSSGVLQLNNKPLSKSYKPELEKGWLKTLKEATELTKEYQVFTYEEIARNKTQFDCYIIDESHNLGSYPLRTARCKAITKLVGIKPHIHLSGTAIVESPMGIYHQMQMGRYSPFKEFRNFYKFFEEYGVPRQKRIAGRLINSYDKCKDSLLPEINKFTVYMEQKDAGITVAAKDKLHFVKLSDALVAIYNRVQDEGIFEGYAMDESFNKVSLVIPMDTVMKLRTTLHMLESGVIKHNEDYFFLGHYEKINYIKDKFGDSEEVGIMSHFKGERILLNRIFKKALILSSTSHAEGVDLSHLKHFIILSNGYSGAKHIQRRERIINLKGSKTTTIHFILVDKALSHQVYKTIDKKKDFNNQTYTSQSL